MPETELPPNVPPPPPSLLEAEKKRYVEQAMVDEKVALLGWESVGVSGAAAEMLNGFQAFAGGKMMATMDVAYGGLMVNYANLSMRMERVLARWAAMDVEVANGGAFNEELDSKLHKQFVELSALRLKFSKATNDAALVRATIAEKMRNEDKTKKTFKLRTTRRPAPTQSNPNATETIEEV